MTPGFAVAFALVGVVSTVIGVCLGAILGYAIASSVSVSDVTERAVEELGVMTRRVAAAAGSRTEYPTGVYSYGENGVVRRLDSTEPETDDDGVELEDEE